MGLYDDNNFENPITNEDFLKFYEFLKGNFYPESET